MDEFDLNASQLPDVSTEGDGTAGGSWMGNGKNYKEIELMVWQKLKSDGHRPSARIGHSACSRGHSLILFGGIEAGLRMNSVHSYDVARSSWQLYNCQGDMPSPRAYHACCVYDERYMIVQGGECTDLWVNGAGKKKSSEVCMGDSIAINATKDTVRLQQGATPRVDEGGETMSTQLRTLDDLYCLDLDTKSWSKVQSKLSPLPRKGHTLNMLRLNLTGQPKDYCVLFGGLATDKNLVGNSVHVCPAADVVKGNVAWRLLACSGDLPGARYRHTSTALHSSTNRGMAVPDRLVVYGGLDHHSNPLSDIHVLDLTTFVWTRYDPSGSQDPPMVYGHVAFATPPKGIPAEASSDESSQPTCTAVTIFGGSTNGSKASLDCLQKMYNFDLSTKQWSIVESSFQYPAQRSGHACAIIEGWCPENSAPIKGMTSDDLTAYDRKGMTMGLKMGSGIQSMVLFGGLNASSICRADVWALDLQWRPQGVASFDNTVNNVAKQELVRLNQASHIGTLRMLSSQSDSNLVTNFNSNTESKTSLIMKQFKKSNSTKNISTTQRSDNPEMTNSTNVFDATKVLGNANFADTVYSCDDDGNDGELNLDEIGSAIHTLRKEKVLADTHYRIERDRADRAEGEIVRLKKSLLETQNTLHVIQKEKDEEIKELRRAFEQEVQKTLYLEGLNEEAYKLLILQGSEKNLGGIEQITNII